MKKKILLVAVLMIATTLFVGNAFAQTAIERLKTEYHAVMEQYGKRLEALKADYVIAIDVSGTMNSYKETVVPALQEFLGSIPDGDYVCIMKFGTVAKEAGLSGQINSGNRTSFEETLSKIYDRDDDCFYQTNLCRMLDFVNDRLNRPGHNDLQYVFMFTDFVEDASTSNAEWEAIATKMKATAQRNMLMPFAMQLNGKGAGKDIPKVRSALPNLRIININSSSELNAWFEDQKADISKTRLKDLILADFDKWYSENKISTELVIGINSGLKIKYDVDEEVVPAFVNGFMLTQCEPVSQSNNIEKVNIKYDTLYKGRNISAKIGSLKFYKHFIWERNVKVSVSTVMRPTFTTGDKDGEPSFANEIRNLGLEEELMRSAELNAENSFVLVWNIWLVVLIALILLLLIVFFIKDTLCTYRLKNLRVHVTDPSGEETSNSPYEFKGVQSLYFGKQGNIIDNSEFVVRIYGRRGYPIIYPRAVIFQILEPTVSDYTLDVDDNSCSSSSVRIKPGQKVNLQINALNYTFWIERI